MTILYNSPIQKDNKNNGIVYTRGTKYEHNTITQTHFTFNDSRINSDPVFGSVVYANVARNDYTQELAKNTNRGLIKGVSNQELSNNVDAVVKTKSNLNLGNIIGSHTSSSVLTRLQSTAYRDGQYLFYKGKYNVGYPDTVWDSFNEDKAAENLNRSNQGRLFFINGKNITSQLYPSKTG